MTDPSIRVQLQHKLAIALLAAWPLMTGVAGAAELPPQDLHRMSADQGHQHGMSPAQDPHGKAGEDHSSHGTLLNKPVGDAGQVKIELEQVTLLNQQGQPLDFAREAVGDKLIALTVFYSSCTTVCPVITAFFAGLQERLGDRMEQDVRLISITVDPITDTPRRLKAYAAKHGAKPGWLWLTGDKLAVDKVLTGLGLYTPDFTEHPATVLVGDGNSGHWSRFYGFPGPAQMLQQLDKLQLARSHEQTASLAKE